MKDEELELLKEFEEKFGFKTYEGLKDVMTRMHVKIQSLTESREKWRQKYEEFKTKED